MSLLKLPASHSPAVSEKNDQPLLSLCHNIIYTAARMFLRSTAKDKSLSLEKTTGLRLMSLSFSRKVFFLSLSLCLAAKC